MSIDQCKAVLGLYPFAPLEGPWRTMTHAGVEQWRKRVLATLAEIEPKPNTTFGADSILKPTGRVEDRVAVDDRLVAEFSPTGRKPRKDPPEQRLVSPRGWFAPATPPFGLPTIKTAWEAEWIIEGWFRAEDARRPGQTHKDVPLPWGGRGTIVITEILALARDEDNPGSDGLVKACAKVASLSASENLTRAESRSTPQQPPVLQGDRESESCGGSVAGEYRMLDIQTCRPVKKRRLIYVLGSTCSGKSSLVEMAAAEYDNVGIVQVGKELRRRYPPEYFKGLGALASTETEVEQILLDEIEKHFRQDKQIVLVDGNPRSRRQARLLGRFPTIAQEEFWWLWCPDALTRLRIHERFAEDLESRRLAEARVSNDRQQLYDLLHLLLLSGVSILPVPALRALPDCKAFLARHLK